MQDDNAKPQASDADPRLDFLREIKERNLSMNPKPDERDWLREGREGTMYET